MADVERAERADDLAAKALKLVAAGQDEDGSRALREAASLAPERPAVKAAFDKIQRDGLEHQLQKLCHKLVSQDDEAAGKEALQYLSRSAAVPADVSKECMVLVMKPRRVKIKKPHHMKLQDMQDAIFSGLLRESTAAKAFLAKALHECKDNSFFEQIYDLGDGAASGIAAVVLDPSAWLSEATREDCERGIFQLYLAKLLEVGDDHNGRALRGIARLLAADAGKLQGYIDRDCFDLILCCLDGRNTIEVRSQATLATAKYLEISKASGQEMLVHFVIAKIARQYNEDLVVAFSAAAAVFPVAPTIASSLFLTEGFVPALVPLLKQKAKSEKVEQAALELLSAACIDSGCREAIRKDCMMWLQSVVQTGRGQGSGLAAVILAKLQGPAKINGNTRGLSHEIHQEMDDLVPRLQTMMMDGAEESKQSAIEGLAYASVRPSVKDQLAKDDAFLRTLLRNLKGSRPGSPNVFGSLTLLENLTRFLPNLSEEQKRMSQLKAYANASKPAAKADPLDEAEAVIERCKSLIDAGIVPVLVNISNSLSSNHIIILFGIMSSISKVTNARGTIAQQGGVKLLLQNYTAITGTTANDVIARRTAAHALARILISTDPSLVFSASGSQPLTSAIRPLISLLTEDAALPSEGPRDLLPTFEAILALTNLASIPSGAPSEIIISQSWSTVENLLLSSNLLIQRATTQLVCNLVNCAKGIELFADESPTASRRLHILLALADVEDKDTRKAAGGALASITDFEGAVKAVLQRDRGVEILLGLCEDDDMEIVHRGLVCIMNIVSTEEDLAREAQIKVRENKGVDVLSAIHEDAENDVIRDIAKETVIAVQEKT